MKSSLAQLERQFFPMLRKKQIEVAYVPPQSMGPLTIYYHRLIPWFKVAPWRLIFIGSLVVTMVLRLLLGSWFVRLASLLQRGF